MKKQKKSKISYEDLNAELRVYKSETTGSLFKFKTRLKQTATSLIQHSLTQFNSSKNEQKRRFYVSARWWRRFMKFGALCVGANQPRHFFTRDTEWMGFETTGLRFLSESYPCDPRLKSTFLICDFDQQ